MSKVPLRLGPYVLIERIGMGGMAEVWRGQWIGPDGDVMPCALKRMRPEVALNEDAVRMFVDERRMSMRLNHANVCRVLPAAGPEPYIAMEWVNGMNLADLTSRLRLGGDLLPYETIRYVLHCLLRGLDHAHTLRVGGVPYPIIHRDVSPQNVMISVHGEVKLMDFGIARVLADETSPAEFAGKLRYCPREQVMGKIKPATDLYAVGAIVHEMVEGSLFRADCSTKAQMLETIQQGRVPVLTRPGVPDWCRALHKALLQPAIDDRPQSAREALANLGRVTAEQDELGQLVSSYLGAQADMSGSTTSHAAAVPVEPEAAPDPVSPGTPDGSPRDPMRPQQDARNVRDGEIIERMPTAVVSKRRGDPPRGPVVHPSSDEGAIPRPRLRPQAEWIRLVKAEPSPEAPVPHPTADEPSEDREPAHNRPEQPAEADAPAAPTQEVASDDVEVTELLPVNVPDKRGMQWSTTAEQAATMAAAPPRARKIAGWLLATVLAPLVGMLGAVALYWTAVSEAHDDLPASLSIAAPREAEVEVQTDDDSWVPVSREIGIAAEPGGHCLRWRPHASTPWQDGGTQRFEPGSPYLLTVTDKGLRVHADDARPGGER